ncbi:MAG: hypothetical protein PHU25_11090 [Deltaproteobacteria bacterium]|nr:hypothetical protein [Deltaproteobacteria bacterium]
MRLASRVAPAIAAAVLFAACGGGNTRGATTPRPEATKMEVALPTPSGTFPIPSGDEEWTPATIGSGMGGMLAKALSDRSTVAMILGRGMDDSASEQRVFDMVKAAAPDTKVVARARATLDGLLEERGEIPYRVTMEPAGTDVLGRPVFLPKEHPLNTDWLQKRQALKGAQAVLTVRRIKVDDQKLRALRESKQGGCQALDADLSKATGSRDSFFAPYVDAADAALTNAFGRQMKKALPFLKDELARLKNELAPDDPGQRCAEGYGALLARFEPCLGGKCAVAPRVFLSAGGIIGLLEDPAVVVPNGCPAQDMRDFAAEIRDAASRSVAEVLPALASSFTGEMVRVEALARLAQGLADECAPRHRRIAPQDLAAARAEVKAFLDGLKTREVKAEWIASSGQERVPRLGPATVLARVSAAGNGPSGEADDLVRRVQGYDRCRNGDERLAQAALVDVGTSEVLFMGVFFDEELLCEGLPPSGR